MKKIALLASVITLIGGLSLGSFAESVPPTAPAATSAAPAKKSVKRHHKMKKAETAPASATTPAPAAQAK